MKSYSTSVAPVLLSVAALTLAIAVSLARPLPATMALTDTSANNNLPTRVVSQHNAPAFNVPLKQKVASATLNAAMTDDVAALTILRSLETEIRHMKQTHYNVFSGTKVQPPEIATPVVQRALQKPSLANQIFLSRLAHTDSIMMQTRKGRGIAMQMKPSSTIVSPDAAEVVYIGKLRSYGQVMILRFNNSQKKYLLLAGPHTPQVRQGVTVKAGDVIGTTYDNVNSELYAEWRSATG